ncbi:FUSC family protein [Pseudodonghicola flavimaris]|uniref:FUSC family protein n=1 Tax=Pseudodonghicola flavimaris TaxID=3050036 RepID=A0ABT7EVU2_9RHOB|nr:FUSC family protein [Pseudodonghicola flavimaris]MDK3016466.1 FUSC family protein [Pseudodonghicola flavimaris]
MMVPGGIRFEHVLFSLKTFGAAMLAYWIALQSGLPNPYWAVGTVYIIVNPLAGGTTSRAVYRLAGTALGAVMIVVLVPNLVFSPLLLSLAIALWCGFCLFVSLLDRSPRSYVFMLAGYTVALTGFTLVNVPGTSFDVAVSRVEEIAIGILCAAVVSRVVFPQHAGPVLAHRVEGWLQNAATLTRDVLTGRSESAVLRNERHKLAADAVSLRGFTDQVAYEGAHGRGLAERMRALQQRMIAVLPLLSEIEDLLGALGRGGSHAPLTERVLEWLAFDADDAAEAQGEADALLAEIARLRQRLDDSAHSWDDLLALRLAGRLGELVEVWADCQVLRSDISSGETHALRRELATRHRQARALHVDYGMALRSALSVVIVVLVGCAFWIWSGWSYGAGIAQIGAILCCVLAAMDNATPVLRKVLSLMLFALAAAFLYKFALMPLIGSFYALVAALGLVLLPAGVLLAVPATWLMGFQISVNLIYMLMLDNQVSTDFSAFANASLATFGGLALAMITIATVRAVSAERSATRLLRSGWRAVSEVAAGSRRIDPELIAGRMTDRLGLIAPRLAMLPPESAVLEGDILRDLRVGLNILELQRIRRELPAAEQRPLDDLLRQIATLYRSGAAGTAERRRALASSLDRCLGDVLSDAGTPQRRLRDALVGLRGGACPGETPPAFAFPDWRVSA